MHALRQAGYTREARRAALDSGCSVEFKGYAYRTLAEGMDPHVRMGSRGGEASGVRRLFETKEVGGQFAVLPEGFQVLHPRSWCIRATYVIVLFAPVCCCCHRRCC